MIETPTTDGRRRQLLLVGAGLAGLLAGLFILYSMFDPADPVAVAPPSTPAADPQDLQPAPPPVAPEPVPALPVGRNPFSQLVVPAQPAPGDPSTDGAPVAPEGGGEPASDSGGQAQEQPAVTPAAEPVAQEPVAQEPARLDQEPSPPPEGEAVAAPDPQPREPSPPPVPGPAVPSGPVATPVTIPAPPPAPVLLNDSLWNSLLDGFQWLHLVAVYDDGAGEIYAVVDVAGRVYTLTVDQALGPYMVEHIEGRCIEVSIAHGSGARALLRTCMPPTAEDPPSGTTAANGECLEIRPNRSFPPPPVPMVLDRRVFLCRDTQPPPSIAPDGLTSASLPWPPASSWPSGG